MADAKLKPCWCGGKAVLKHEQVAEDCMMSWVQCRKCGARSAEYKSPMGSDDPVAW
jgi:hypothetical protein